MTRARFAERAAELLPGIVAGAPNPARVRGGREGLLAGLAWEALLDRHHQRAAVAGLFAVWQAGRPVIALRDDGSPVYGVAPVDFVGVALDGSARAVAVEAKSTAGARLDRSAIGERQSADLDAVTRADGLAVVAIELRAVGERYALTWRELCARWSGPRGGASVGADDLAGFELLDGPAGYLRRFIGGAR